MAPRVWFAYLRRTNHDHMLNEVRSKLGKLRHQARIKMNQDPGSPYRPVGDIKQCLENLKHCGLKPKTILDVGANYAEWSKMASTVFPDAAYCLIEPQVELEGPLKEFCATGPNNTYHIAGAGPELGEMKLTIWDDLAGSSFLPPAEDGAEERGKQRTVPIITIDSMIEKGDIQMPELIKLDVQGFELEALKGAKSTFGKTEVFILEVSLIPFDDLPNSPIFADVIKFMDERDYVAYDFPGFMRRPLDGALGQCDVCFVKRNSFLLEKRVWQ